MLFDFIPHISLEITYIELLVKPRSTPDCYCHLLRLSLFTQMRILGGYSVCLIDLISYATSTTLLMI